MSAAHLTDAEIRRLLKDRLSGRYRHQRDAVILDELGVCRGQVRIDVVLVNCSIHGYEIKSGRDSLRRLPGQADYYSKVLDYATVVVSRCHLQAVMREVPTWWGVMEVSGDEPNLKVVRNSRRNPWRDTRALVEFLWLDDALALLERHNLDRGARGKPRRFVWDRICEEIDPGVIATAVRDKLKARARPQSD